MHIHRYTQWSEPYKSVTHVYDADTNEYIGEEIKHKQAKYCTICNKRKVRKAQ